jgi:hypothetical protein
MESLLTKKVTNLKKQFEEFYPAAKKAEGLTKFYPGEGFEWAVVAEIYQRIRAAKESLGVRGGDPEYVARADKFFGFRVLTDPAKFAEFQKIAAPGEADKVNMELKYAKPAVDRLFEYLAGKEKIDVSDPKVLSKASVYKAAELGYSKLEKEPKMDFSMQFGGGEIIRVSLKKPVELKRGKEGVGSIGLWYPEVATLQDTFSRLLNEVITNESIGKAAQKEFEKQMSYIIETLKNELRGRRGVQQKHLEAFLDAIKNETYAKKRAGGMFDRIVEGGIEKITIQEWAQWDRFEAGLKKVQNDITEKVAEVLQNETSANEYFKEQLIREMLSGERDFGKETLSRADLFLTPFFCVRTNDPKFISLVARTLTFRISKKGSPITKLAGHMELTRTNMKKLISQLAGDLEDWSGLLGKKMEKVKGDVTPTAPEEDGGEKTIKEGLFGDAFSSIFSFFMKKGLSIYDAFSRKMNSFFNDLRGKVGELAERIFSSGEISASYGISDVSFSFPPQMLTEGTEMEREKIVIDLTQGEKLEEDMAAAFGARTLLALQAAFGYRTDADIYVRGSGNAISAFMGALSGEKKYIEAVNRYGLNDPKVIGDRYRLQDAIRRFEQSTHLVWPFKG